MRLLQSSMHQLLSLNLSNDSFRTGQKYIGTHEQLAKYYQQLLYLKRCRSYSIFPPHILNIRLPKFIHNDRNESLKLRILSSILNREIRELFISIHKAKSSLASLKETIQSFNENRDQILGIATLSYNNNKDQHKNRLKNNEINPKKLRTY